MKKLSVFILLISCSLWNFGQEVLFEDTFDVENESWVGSDNYVKEYKNGALILHGYLRKEMVIVLREIILDPAKDYSISCRIKYDVGHTKKSYGLILFDSRFTNKPKAYHFMLYPQDAYQIQYINSSRSKILEAVPKKTKSGILKAPGEYNELELRNTNGILEYYINKNKVWSNANFDFCISMIGFTNNGYQDVDVDDFAIRQDGWRNINIVEDSNKIYKKENLGKNINSEADELAPIISADGKILYLTVDGDKANVGNNDEQDIWYSKLNPDSTWGKRINIGYPLNNDGNNSIDYVTPDNNTLFVGNTYDKNGKWTGQGLSVSHRQKGGWSVPLMLNIDNYYNNNEHYSRTYSPTGNLLISSIERDDTYGAEDLYVSFKEEDGTWSEPANMGPDINTFSDDMAPFLAADNTTLYFSTDARPGYGDNDIFMTRRLDDTWKSWSEPVNLGPNINTPGWDAYFTIPASGNYSYLVSSDNSFGNGDIFRVKVSEAAKPNPVALIQGKVYNLKTSEFLEASITYSDLGTNQEIGTARSNPDDGTYKISLPAGHKYSFYAQKDGYFSVSENIDLTGMEAYAEIIKDLYLSKMEVGQAIRLNNIFFDYDKSELLEGSVYELDRLVTIMNENPEIVIQIAGHTDNLGTEAYNQRLSEDRARAVYNYLKSKGIGDDRVSFTGYGKSKPVETNDTDEGRALNRRVEFVIVSK